MANISQNMSDWLPVLVFYTGNYNDRLHASKVARSLKLPQRTVARKFGALEKLGLLNFQKEGRNKYYFLDLTQPLSFALLEIAETYKEIMFFLKHSHLAEVLGELSQNYGCILFGSYAKGRAKENSDVDAVIFSRKNKKIVEILEKSPFEINLHYVSLSLFEKRLKENWPLAKEIAKDHVLLGEKEKVIKALVGYYQR